MAVIAGLRDENVSNNYAKMTHESCFLMIAEPGFGPGIGPGFFPVVPAQCDEPGPL